MGDYLKFPLELVDGQFATVDRGPDEIRGNAHVIAACPQGWVDSDRSFGVPPLVHRLPNDRALQVQDAINRLEPRAGALASETLADLTGKAVRIQVQLGGQRGS